MSDRPLIAPNNFNPVVNAVSMAASFNTPPTIIQRLPGISYDLSWTGTPTGTFAVQVSNTYQLGLDGVVLNAGNWYDLPSAALIGTLPTPAGTDGTGFIDVIGTEAYAVRLAYTASSGDGNLTAVIAAKVI